MLVTPIILLLVQCLYDRDELGTPLYLLNQLLKHQITVQIPNQVIVCSLVTDNEQLLEDLVHFPYVYLGVVVRVVPELSSLQKLLVAQLGCVLVYMLQH